MVTFTISLLISPNSFLNNPEWNTYSLSPIWFSFHVYLRTPTTVSLIALRRILIESLNPFPHKQVSVQNLSITMGEKK